MIPESRCRAKLHGIFKHAQRQSRDGRFSLLLGGSDQLVGSPNARLSSVGIVVLSTATRLVGLSCIVPGRTLPFFKCRWILCAFDFPSKKHLTLFSVSVPVHLKLARQCDTLKHVCSFSGTLHQSWKGHFIHRAHRVRCASFVARVLVHSFHAKNSWTDEHRWLG